VIGTTAILATTIGLNYALNKPGIPKPEDGSQALKAAIPPRIRGYGTNRLAGFYMLFEAAGPAPATSYDVIALHSGRITKIDRFILSDDPVNLSGDISLGGGPVTFTAGLHRRPLFARRDQIESRIGAPASRRWHDGDPDHQRGLDLAIQSATASPICGMSCDSGDRPKALYAGISAGAAGTVRFAIARRVGIRAMARRTATTRRHGSIPPIPSSNCSTS
jgi:hypothetical protein